MVAHAPDGVSAEPMAQTVPVDNDQKNNVEYRTENGQIDREKNKDSSISLPTIDDFRHAIPAHCFERNITRSLRYLIQDYAVLIALYITVPYFEYYGHIFGLILWYCLVGVFGFALFVVGHDCLHGSFSDSQLINDICGHIAYAPIFAPYYPWQKSHKLHHRFTNHLEKDKGHPWNQEMYYISWPFWKKYFSAFPLSGWIEWIPVYTVFGYSDGSHFWPWSRLFERNEERIKCVFSCTMCFLCAYASFLICGSDLYTWFKYYWIPLSFYGLMLVMVTYLQHHGEQSEVYDDGEWSFVRGQTQTIDRTYGFGLDDAMHNITDGHVAHHLFTKIPHYHLLDATESVKKVLEPLKHTPYNYKHEISYDFFTRFLWYNIKYDYLISKCKGIWQYRRTVLEEKLSSKMQ
uniref:FA_desaturase domain-containing protein n=1 Tax=Heterorhabditis bacteriophora TaxID=37862 RepID=A0A1I7WMI0_HETBA